MTLENIIKKIPSKYSKDVFIIYKALDEMIKNKTEVMDKYGRHGYLIYKGNYYIFQPSQINNQDLLMYQRRVPPPIRPNMIDLSEYVQKMGEHKKQLEKEDVYKTDDVIDYVNTQIENIKNQTADSLFVSSFKISNDEIVNRIKIDYGIGCFIEYNIILGLEENNYIIDTTIMSTFKKVIGFIKNKQNETNN